MLEEVCGCINLVHNRSSRNGHFPFLYLSGEFLWWEWHLHEFLCLMICIWLIKPLSILFQEVAVQLPSHLCLFVIPWTVVCQASLSLSISRSLTKSMFIASVMPSNHLILWCPLFLLPSIFPSFRDFSNESSFRIRWPKYWSFSISPSSEYSGLISLKIDWFDLLAVQGTFRSLLQHHSSKASILWHSAFFMVQLSQLYVTTEKTTQTFVGRVMSLLFNTLEVWGCAMCLVA